jgi:hypothetical protein
MHRAKSRPDKQTRARRRPGLVAVVACSALGVTSAGFPSASATTAPTPPSWLDLVAQMGQIAHAANPALQSLDAIIRDGLNGTTEGYVYSLVSDAVQMASSLKDLTGDTTTLARDWSRATTKAQAAKSGYAQERSFYTDWYKLMNEMPSPCVGSGATRDQCDHDGVMVIHWWEDYPKDPSLGPPRTVGGTVSSTSLDAYYNYNSASAMLTEVLTEASEVLLEARAITGDAHDYPSNKEIEAIVQVIGEHNIASQMAKFAGKATNLRPHLAAQATAMGNISTWGKNMAGMVGVSDGSMAPPPAA